MSFFFFNLSRGKEKEKGPEYLGFYLQDVNGSFLPYCQIEFEVAQTTA